MKKKTPLGSADLIVPSDPASTKYVNDLIEQGKAARAGADGALPPGATHESVGETETGAPILRRRRFG
jgi:hypothetical protein